MNLEHRLSDHLLRASAQLEAPPDRLERVVRRGRRRRSAQRGAAALVGVAAVLAAPAMIRGVRGTVVELAPAAPPSVPLTAPPIPNGDGEPQEGQVPASAPASDPAQADGAGLTLTQLPAPVLAFGPYEHDQLRIVSRDEDRTFGVPADAAFPDGQGGVIYQPAGLAELRWSGAAQPLVDLGPGDRRLLLRGLLPGGRVLYSVLPAAQEMVEGSVEEFFALDLAAGAEPVLLTTAGAYERTVVGPAVAAGRRLVHASCHLHCRLWLGLAEPEAEEPLYNGLGIDGLTATPDGAVIAFVEHDPAAPEGAAPRRPWCCWTGRPSTSSPGSLFPRRARKAAGCRPCPFRATASARWWGSGRAHRRRGRHRGRRP